MTRRDRSRKRGKSSRTCRYEKWKEVKKRKRIERREEENMMEKSRGILECRLGRKAEAQPQNSILRMRTREFQARLDSIVQTILFDGDACRGRRRESKARRVGGREEEERKKRTGISTRHRPSYLRPLSSPSPPSFCHLPFFPSRVVGSPRLYSPFLLSCVPKSSYRKKKFTSTIEPIVILPAMFQVPNGCSMTATLLGNGNSGGPLPSLLPPFALSTQGPSPNVDDGLTSLSWLQNLNMCMTRLGAPTPPTPPASPNNKSIPSLSSTISGSSTLYPQTQGFTSQHPSIGSHQSDQSLLSIPAPTHHNHPPKRTSKKKQQEQRNNQSNGSQSSTSSSTSSKCLAETPSEQTRNGCPSTPSMQEEAVDYRLEGSVKPPYSYATLICMAMRDNKSKMTLNSIYKWIRENFLYYQNADPSWQNSIRHNLSLNKCFIKIPRTKEEPGKGGFWRLDPLYAETLVDGVFKKRRPAHRPSGSSNASSYRKKRKKDKSTLIEISEGSIPIAEVTDTAPVMLDANFMSMAPSRETVIEGCIPRGSTTMHETPPSSAESYPTMLEGGNCETIELTNAVNSIDQSLHTSNVGVSCHYQVYGTNNVPTSYGEEVCIQSLPINHCVMGPSAGAHEHGQGDICWNILAENDLEFANPINYSCQVVQHENSNSTCNCDECIVGNLMTNFIV